MIKANTKSAQIKGTTYEVGVSLTNLFHTIYTEYGLNEGQKLIDEAMNLAIKS